MRIAYLVNLYPWMSHTFIRREIHALEARGFTIDRVSIRRVTRDQLADPLDIAECDATTALLDGGVLSLLFAMAVVKLTSPIRYIRACLQAFRMSRTSARGLLTHMAYLAEACRLKRYCHANAVDHVHAHFFTNPAAVAMLCHTLGGPTWSVTVHGATAFDELGVMSAREKLSDASFAVAISHHGRSQLMRFSTPERWDLIRQINCGLDESVLGVGLQPFVTRTDAAARTIVCVGRLCPQKGQVSLVNAVRTLRERGRNVRLVLVGDGELRSMIETQMRDHDLGDAVELRGWADQAGVRDALIESDVMALPSSLEGKPVVIMEAFAMGRPVVTTWVNGIPELVKSSENGWLVPPGDDESLVAALEEVLDSPPAELVRRGAAGRERVLRDHDIETIADQLAECFRRYGANG